MARWEFEPGHTGAPEQRVIVGGPWGLLELLQLLGRQQGEPVAGRLAFDQVLGYGHDLRGRTPVALVDAGLVALAAGVGTCPVRPTGCSVCGSGVGWSSFVVHEEVSKGIAVGIEHGHLALGAGMASSAASAVA